MYQTTQSEWMQLLKFQEPLLESLFNNNKHSIVLKNANWSPQLFNQRTTQMHYTKHAIYFSYIKNSLKKGDKKALQIQKSIRKWSCDLSIPVHQ